MLDLYVKLDALESTDIPHMVAQRLSSFEQFKQKSSEEWFRELCFCILTSNSKAKTAIAIEQQLGADGFLTLPEKLLVKVIRENKHRFHNNKAKYIVEARKFANIKQILEGMTPQQAREWLVKNIKGFGYKEASHFLRNTGTFHLAVLDRHIINTMHENKIISKKPKTLSKKTYLDLEKKFLKISEEFDMLPAELDLYMWSMKTGTVIK